jgi:hypothetical protein
LASETRCSDVFTEHIRNHASELMSRRLALMLDGLDIADRTALALALGIEGVKVRHS